MADRVSMDVLVRELEAALNRKDGYIMGSYGQNPRTGYRGRARLVSCGIQE